MKEQMNKQSEKAHCLLHDICQTHFKTIPSLRLLAFIVLEKSLTKKLILTSMVRKEKWENNEQISRGSPLSLTQYKSSIFHCIPSLRLLDWPIWKERRMKEQMNKNNLRKPTASYMIYVKRISNYTKFEASSFYSS